MNQNTRKHVSVLEGLYQTLSTDVDLLSITGYPAYERMRAELGLVLQEMGSEMVRQDAIERHRELLAHPACRAFNMHEHAPLQDDVRDRLWRRVRALPDGEMKAFCAKHFELGCWLHHYKDSIEAGMVFNRIDCLRRIVAHDIHPKYILLFSDVFGFGQPQLDGLLHQVYLEQVIHPLRAIARAHPMEAYGLFFSRMGWQIDPMGSAAAA